MLGASPSLTSARERASIPSAKSVSARARRLRRAARARRLRGPRSPHGRLPPRARTAPTCETHGSKAYRGRLPRRRRGLLVSAEPVVEDRGCPAAARPPRALASGCVSVDRARDQVGGLGFAPLECARASATCRGAWGSRSPPQRCRSPRSATRHPEVPSPRARYRPMSRGGSELRERAGVANEPHLSRVMASRGLRRPIRRCSRPWPRQPHRRDILTGVVATRTPPSARVGAAASRPSVPAERDRRAAGPRRTRLVSRRGSRAHGAADLQQASPPAGPATAMRRAPGGPDRSRAQGRCRTARVAAPPRSSGGASSRDLETEAIRARARAPPVRAEAHPGGLPRPWLPARALRRTRRPRSSPAPPRTRARGVARILGQYNGALKKRSRAASPPRASSPVSRQFELKATSSSGPAAAAARCQARWSGSARGSVASASAGAPFRRCSQKPRRRRRPH